MDKPFLKVLPPDEARKQLGLFSPLASEHIPLDRAAFRVLAENIQSSEDIPPFDRSTMDGFAVRCSDTFGATETSPGMLGVVGEALMGEIPSLALGRGEAARIWTGGALPANADAVVMVEHTENLGCDTIEVLKAAAPFDNVVRRGEDFKAGETLLCQGRRLRPQDLGGLAAIGRSSLQVFKAVRVDVVSSGDEIVPVETEPPPGCVRDVNRYTLTAGISGSFATPIWMGIAADRMEDLSSLIDRGMEAADLLLISGGSSMGSRDLVIEAILAYKDSEILFHGVSISPGKPLILGRVGPYPVVGLPGHPASAMVCFDQFVVPLIRRLSGERVLTPFLKPTFQALLSRNVPSKEGRVDFVRVRLRLKEGSLSAVPIPAKSGMISSMVRADGFVVIDEHCEGLYKGDVVTVNLFADWTEESNEKEYLSGYENPRGSACDFLEASTQEKLSRI
jgi:molybdopterin molybdotransferase